VGLAAAFVRSSAAGSLRLETLYRAWREQKGARASLIRSLAGQETGFEAAITAKE
jgi:hypothetical protein